MYRLFVAIDLPDEVRKQLAEMKANMPEARWVPIDQLHLTLRFIGDADEPTFRLIKSALAEVTVSRLTLTMKSIGHFPPGRQPRVLWVGLEENRLLLELQAQVEKALKNAGIPPEGRRFSPHITLARFKEAVPASVAAFEERHRDFRAGPFSISEFYLYSSTLTRTGAIHTREAIYQLATS